MYRQTHSFQLYRQFLSFQKRSAASWAYHTLCFSKQGALVSPMAQFSSEILMLSSRCSEFEFEKFLSQVATRSIVEDWGSVTNLLF
jgi:hypothetical protein